MGQITSFVICDSISNMGVAPVLVAPQIVLRPQFIPGNFSFGIGVGISGVDLSKTNKIRFVIKNPNGTVVQDSGESELPIPQQDAELDLKYRGFMMCMDIRNMPVEVSGEYEFLIELNGVEVGKNIIPIYKKAM